MPRCAPPCSGKNKTWFNLKNIKADKHIVLILIKSKVGKTSCSPLFFFFIKERCCYHKQKLKDKRKSEIVATLLDIE